MKKQEIEVEKREILESSYYAQPCGRSFYVVRCPFCNAEVTIYAWSYAGSGKRCTCGALMHNQVAKKGVK